MQFAVGSGELQGVADVAGRCTHIAVRERHDFGPRRGARGVQNQRHIVRLGRAGQGGLALLCRHQFKMTRALLGQGFERYHGHAELGRHGQSWGLAARRHDQGLGFQVAQVKLKLIGAVGHVQGRGGAGAGHGHKSGGHFGAVGQHDGHSVAPANAHGIQRRQGLRHQGVQAPVRKRHAAGRHHGRGCARLLRKHVVKGAEVGHGVQRFKKFSSVRRAAASCWPANWPAHTQPLWWAWGCG